MPFPTNRLNGAPVGKASPFLSPQAASPAMPARAPTAGGTAAGTSRLGVPNVGAMPGGPGAAGAKASGTPPLLGPGGPLIGGITTKTAGGNDRPMPFAAPLKPPPQGVNWSGGGGGVGGITTPGAGGNDMAGRAPYAPAPPPLKLGDPNRAPGAFGAGGGVNASGGAPAGGTAKVPPGFTVAPGYEGLIGGSAGGGGRSGNGLFGQRVENGQIIGFQRGGAGGNGSPLGNGGNPMGGNRPPGGGGSPTQQYRDELMQQISPQLEGIKRMQQMANEATGGQLPIFADAQGRQGGVNYGQLGGGPMQMGNRMQGDPGSGSGLSGASLKGFPGRAGGGAARGTGTPPPRKGGSAPPRASEPFIVRGDVNKNLGNPAAEESIAVTPANPVAPANPFGAADGDPDGTWTTDNLPYAPFATRAGAGAGTGTLEEEYPDSYAGGGDFDSDLPMDDPSQGPDSDGDGVPDAYQDTTDLTYWDAAGGKFRDPRKEGTAPATTPDKPDDPPPPPPPTTGTKPSSGTYGGSDGSSGTSPAGGPTAPGMNGGPLSFPGGGGGAGSGSPPNNGAPGTPGAPANGPSGGSGQPPYYGGSPPSAPLPPTTPTGSPMPPLPPAGGGGIGGGGGGTIGGTGYATPQHAGNEGWGENMSQSQQGSHSESQSAGTSASGSTGRGSSQSTGGSQNQSNSSTDVLHTFDPKDVGNYVDKYAREASPDNPFSDQREQQAKNQANAAIAAASKRRMDELGRKVGGAGMSLNSGAFQFGKQDALQDQLANVLQSNAEIGSKWATDRGQFDLARTNQGIQQRGQDISGTSGQKTSLLGDLLRQSQSRGSSSGSSNQQSTSENMSDSWSEAMNNANSLSDSWGWSNAYGYNKNLPVFMF